MNFTEEQLRAAMAVALRARDAAMNEAVTLALELEGAKARIKELEAKVGDAPVLVQD